jgi:hypothetical protein
MLYNICTDVLRIHVQFVLYKILCMIHMYKSQQGYSAAQDTTGTSGDAMPEQVETTVIEMTSTTAGTQSCKGRDPSNSKEHSNSQ